MKRKPIFLVLFLALTLTIFCGCDVEVTKEELKSSVINWSDLKKLEDIDENMLIKNSISNAYLTYACKNINNGFSLKFRKFTGVDHYVSINVIEDCDVVMSIEGPDSKVDFKSYIILSNGHIIELLKDSSIVETSYSLTKGDNIVALTGYKAKGTFNIYLEPQEGVEIKKID